MFEWSAGLPDVPFCPGLVPSLLECPGCPDMGHNVPRSAISSILFFTGPVQIVTTIHATRARASRRFIYTNQNGGRRKSRIVVRLHCFCNYICYCRSVSEVSCRLWSSWVLNLWFAPQISRLNKYSRRKNLVLSHVNTGQEKWCKRRECWKTIVEEL